jgi:hypothetical protein
LNIFGLKERKELGVEQKTKKYSSGPSKRQRSEKEKLVPPPPSQKNLVEKKYILLPNLVPKVLFLL